MEQENLDNIILTEITKGTPHVEIAKLVLQYPDEEVSKQKINMLRSVHKVKESDIAKAKRALKCNEELGCEVSNETDYVKAYCKKYNVEPKLDGTISGSDFMIFGDSKVYLKDVEGKTDSISKAYQKRFNERDEEYYVDSMLIQSNALGFHFNEKTISTIFQRYINNKSAQMIVEIVDTLSYSVAGSAVVRQKDLWNKLYDNAFKHPENDKHRELVIAIIKNFIHSVKRKLIGEKPDFIVMPIFCGPQKTGKSYFMETLLSPLKSFLAESTMNEVADGRTIDLFKHYVIVLDELVRGDKTEWSRVKNNITADSVQGRILGSNSRKTQKNNASFIGATNLAKEQVIGDETGGRRFFGIYFTTEKSDELYKNRDEVYENIIAMWRSVDENSPSPLLDFKEELDEVNEETRTKSDVELWLEDEEVYNLVLSKKNRMLLKDLFVPFQEWASVNAQQSYRAKSVKLFMNDFKRLVNDKKIDYSLDYSSSKKYYVVYEGTVEKEENNIEILKNKKVSEISSMLNLKGSSKNIMEIAKRERGIK